MVAASGSSKLQYAVVDYMTNEVRYEGHSGGLAATYWECGTCYASGRTKTDAMFHALRLATNAKIAHRLSRLRWVVTGPPEPVPAKGDPTEAEIEERSAAERKQWSKETERTRWMGRQI